MTSKQPWSFADMLQREIAFLGLLVDQGGMALAEGAALRILARQADIEAFIQQGAERQRFGGGPVEAFAGLEHLGLGFQLARDGLVQVEAWRAR